LRETLGLELNQDKTLITHARTQRARFLGYDISVWHCNTKITSGRRAANGKIALKVPPDVITAQCARYRKHGKPWHRPRLQNLDGYEIGRVNPNWPHRSPLIRLHLSVAPGLEFSFDLAPALWAWIAASQKLAAGLPPSGPGAGGPGRDAVECLAF